MPNSSTPVYACPEVQDVQRLHADLFTDSFRNLPIVNQLDHQANRILTAHQDGDPAVLTHLRCWHPELVGMPSDKIMSYDLSQQDARETIAREYGFANWESAQRDGSRPPTAAFEEAVDALLRGDIVDLQTRLRRRPELVTERSDFGHRATLLHYVGSNGVETHRQVVPSNLPAITRLLLDAGADVNAEAHMYGGGRSTLALVITSDHPVQAGVAEEIVSILIEAGAHHDPS